MQHACNMHATCMQHACIHTSRPPHAMHVARADVTCHLQHCLCYEPRAHTFPVAPWQAAVGDDSAASLLVMPPDVFFPLWDSSQAQNFKDFCVQESGVAVSTPTVELGSAVAATCKRLEGEGFVPTLPSDGTAFAAHHWAHTWLDGFGAKFVADAANDVVMLDEGPV